MNSERPKTLICISEEIPSPYRHVLFWILRTFPTHCIAMSRASMMPRTRVSNVGPTSRPQSKDGNEKDMWSSLLDSVASGKRLPEKNLIVLGGAPDMQRDFLDTLASDTPRRSKDKHRSQPPIANEFALGYTYQDVLDADHEDILARLSIYLMSDSSPAFASLLKPLLKPQSIPESLLVILLDWNEPWLWARHLRKWISLLRSITASLDRETEEVAEHVMKEWQQRKRGPSTYDTGAMNAGSEASVTLPLGEGEWDVPLGLPLCVVCHNADKIASIEIEQNWREEDFDFVLQFLRTVLLKHGAALIYTSNSTPNSLPTLIHASLGIHSLLKKQALKHNVIDRDKILVPPNWDSFGKIRVIREGFDVEKISAGWNEEIDRKVDDPSGALLPAEGGVLEHYETTITDPYASRSRETSVAKPAIEVSTPSTQAFLTSQLEVVERLKAEEEQAGSHTESSRPPTLGRNERMDDQIGPVQVNMGGIQVDADDMLRKLKSTQRDSSNPARSTESSGGDSTSPASATLATPDREMKAQNEDLNHFFTGLLKRGAGGSPRNTPGQDGKKGTPKRKDEEGGRKLFGSKE